MIPPEPFQADFVKIKAALRGHTDRAYFVGGATRDYLLGRGFNDVDIEIYDIPPDRFDKIMRTLGAIGVGKSFFVYKYGAFDLSLPRSERKTGRGHTAFDVAWQNDPIAASRRRDFTINAIMIDIFSGELLDFNGGERDLKTKTIRHIDDRAFAEDSLRVLRAARFAATLDFRIAPETIKLCQAIELDDLSGDRVRAELEKLADAPFRVKGVYYLIKLGAAKRLFGYDRADLKLFRWAKRAPLYYALGCYWRDKKKIFPLFGRTKKISQPSPPKQVSDRFLSAIAYKKPLKEWDGAAIFKLQNHRFYDRKLHLQITAAELMKNGFSGAALGRELKKRALEAFRRASRSRGSKADDN
ncbi:MAG: CCA tRNA nucleotidyltransferase [Helicobacteraceae bacterium]|nr:CCA tRNA nucleotidyltransferase [Helicobacteraceae bacterium]